ncbi:MAG: ATP-binding domain-containing protein [Firmicutes bacterium]|nr:ATP-binding domain-containing protein [Bacillota bacterium]
MGLQSETLLRLAEGFRDLPTFVRALTLRRDGSQERKGRGAPGATDGKREDEGPETEEAVAILTLHAAKGLEFPVVFVAGADDGLLPLHMEDEKDAAERLDEERRLFYVGITRAQRELVLISAHTRTLRSQRVTCSPSPFLADLPAGVLREETPDAAAARRRKGPEGRQLALQF